jgi:hypothetical protein
MLVTIVVLDTLAVGDKIFKKKNNQSTNFGSIKLFKNKNFMTCLKCWLLVIGSVTPCLNHLRAGGGYASVIERTNIG